MGMLESSMQAFATFMVVVVVPVVSLAGILVALRWRERTHEMRIARQAALTDAIHRRLGAVVAPVVTRRLGGGWRAEIAVPFDSPALVAEILAITHASLGSALEDVLLTAQEPAVRRNIQRLRPASTWRPATGVPRAG